MYDTSNTGVLSCEELKFAVQKVHGKKDLNKVMKAITELMDNDDSRDINKKEYLRHVKRFPALVFPVFSVQDTMRQHIMGESYWKKMEKPASIRKREPYVQELLADVKGPARAHNDPKPKTTLQVGHNGKIKVGVDPIAVDTHGGSTGGGTISYGSETTDDNKRTPPHCNIRDAPNKSHGTPSHGHGTPSQGHHHHGHHHHGHHHGHGHNHNEGSHESHH